MKNYKEQVYQLRLKYANLLEKYTNVYSELLRYKANFGELPEEKCKLVHLTMRGREKKD